MLQGDDVLKVFRSKLIKKVSLKSEFVINIGNLNIQRKLLVFCQTAGCNLEYLTCQSNKYHYEISV